MTLCVYACFVKFYMLVFDEIHVRGNKIVYKNIWAGNIWANIPKEHTRVIEE